jgi:hypothetical protein
MMEKLLGYIALTTAAHANSMSAAVVMLFLGTSWIETVIKAVLVLDGTELYTIGYLPRHVAARPEEAERLHNKFAQVIELYDETPVGLMWNNKSLQNRGMASYILLDNVPAME